MPKAKSSVFDKLGSKAKSAFNKHKKDETRLPGGGTIPEGIENGIAKVTKCEFAEYSKGGNKGKPYFICVATIVSPQKFRGKRVEGLKITWMEPLCETPKATRKTVEEHIDHMTNFLRLLGLDTSELEFEDIEAGLETLVENETEVAFRTWKSTPTDAYPNPRVNTTWEGLYEGDDEDEEDEDEEDVIEEDEEDEEDEDEVFVPASDFIKMTYTQVAKLADDDDESAQDYLENACEELGLDIEEYDTYKACAIAIKKAAESSDEEEDEDEEESFEKGDVVSYKPPRARKSKDMEVTSVNKRKKTLGLKCLETSKSYPSVSFAKVTFSEE